MPETMRYVWEAVLGIWTILSCILLQHEWQQNKRLRHLARTEKTNANLYLEKWMTAHKEKMAVDSELAATKMALEMEQKNMSTTQEHMKFYIDSCRDLEKNLQAKIEEYERLQADYDNYREFSELTCAGPQPFGQLSAAHDPKIPNEVYEGESVRKQGEQ